MVRFPALPVNSFVNIILLTLGSSSWFARPRQICRSRLEAAELEVVGDGHGDGVELVADHDGQARRPALR
jgi:hypothetical protein